MRKIIVPFAMLSLTALPMVACDVEDTNGDATTNTTTNPTDTGGDTTETIRYFTVIVDDSVEFPEHRSDGGNPCATSSVGAHGADIDAVELLNASSSLGYWSATVYQAGTECDIAAKYMDADEAEGAPNGTLLENFVSLGGGRIGGEFTASAIELLPGYTVIVYEVDDAVGGIAEGYSVSITEQNSCLTSNDCSVIEIGSGEGEGTYELSGF